jgi:hypothetical protein
MAKDWIETLAEDIRQRNRDAALEYGRAQHFRIPGSFCP